ncbi:bifunctional diaminohydroxyphosphoribosylaminopyrimidine deaminase/5-amino-6-(5-phosphoribosylamino)uracil reductase RibD [Kistimonas asteriae]|uniref:bifunctional diaminohydroxyphosphoribosylaminopyrimidine deaminase/5-amino-6-(5-phosphoribosylamino)uracil reductase RibD n=1 Tax=Kistimonas asteriae TaxID=517724 RepID=UPI001BAB5DBE|nr:bifunctional diaminohydroxyphosphoribosylaminopyrimidine deaminase/5-amino-6-(5-phosphoribosylamino)uracil reductase RibD [Kistimonas asteriae]
MTSFTREDRGWMARALQLARKGLYSTMPNPRVGCVLVRDGRRVGEGWHVRAGDGHAEVNALAMAGDNACGSTAYVTLEPCSHQGRTPPCAQALIDAGVSRVIAAMRDPNPRVDGGGFQRLEQAGITTASGLLEEEAKALNPGFIARMVSQRPLVRCKLAMSLDGRTAMASGESQWITGPDARSDVQQWRAQSCAIVTGVGSILQDDSSLTVRPAELHVDDPELAAEKQPLRVVLDSSLSIPLTAKILQQPGKTLVVTAHPDREKQNALQSEGVEVVELPAPDGRVDLVALMTLLGQRECNEVLVETGATLAGSFLQAGLLDELLVYMAPVLMGSAARPLFDLPLGNMSDRIPLTMTDVRRIGQDLRLIAIPGEPRW